MRMTRTALRQSLRRLAAVCAAGCLALGGATAAQAAESIPIDAAHFPDENFRKCVKRIGTDYDDVLTAEEINKGDHLSCNSSGVQSIRGVEYLRNLKTLYLKDNNLTSVDVSKNTALTTLSLGGNKLTTLDVSFNRQLTELSAPDNNLTSVTGLEELANLNSLDLADNQIMAIDLTNNPKLGYEYDVDFSNNNLASLDLSNNPNVRPSCKQINGNPLVAMKVHNDGSETEEEASASIYVCGTKYATGSAPATRIVDSTATTLDLKALAPFFDTSMVANLTGGTIDGNGVLTRDAGATTVKYDYRLTDIQATEYGRRFHSDVADAYLPVTISFTGGAGTSTPTPCASTDDAAGTESMHRLYNPYSGEHFYTGSAVECGTLEIQGWSYEGVGWVAPTSSGTPVYRMYNPIAGDHHYTTSLKERGTLEDQGWSYEGVGWYSAENAGRVSLWRQYNPNAAAGSHNYTLSTQERDMLLGNGWIDEGEAWYSVSA